MVKSSYDEKTSGRVNKLTEQKENRIEQILK